MSGVLLFQKHSNACIIYVSQGTHTSLAEEVILKYGVSGSSTVHIFN